jgi:hypothetical protein
MPFFFFALYVIFSKRDIIQGVGGDAFVKYDHRDWKRPEAFKKHVMWVVLVAFTMKLKRSTPYLLPPTPKIDNVIVKFGSTSLKD